MNKIRGNINRLICGILAILSLMTCVPSASAARYVLDEDDDFDLSSGGTLMSLEEVGVQYENMAEGDYQMFTKRLNTVVNAQYAHGIGANIVTDTPSAEDNEIWRLKHAGIGVYFTLSPLHAPKTFLSAQGFEKGLTLSGIVTDDCLWRAAKNADGSYTLHCKNGTVMDTHNCGIDQVGTEIISFESNGTDAQKYWLSCISEVNSLTPSTRVKAFNKKCAILVDARLNKALNIQYAKANGGLAVVDTYNGESNEIFNIYARRNNLVSIHPLHAPDYALSCKNGNPVAGNQVVLQKYTDSDFNLWEVYKFNNGTYGFRNYKTKLFLDNYWGDTTDGTKIIAHSYNGSKAQQYALKDISAPAPAPSPITQRLNAMINGSYGSNTYKTGTRYAGAYSSEQCKGFAKKVHMVLFGYNIGSTKSKPNNYQINIVSKNTSLVGSLTSLASKSDGSVRNLFASARPGDFIQVRRSHGGSHSMIFLSADANGVSVYECNVDGRNGIRTATYSWNKFRSDNTAVSVYTARNYYLH